MNAPVALLMAALCLSPVSGQVAPESAAAVDPPPVRVIRKEEKRLFGIVPNYKSVAAHSEVHALSPREKFAIAAKDTWDPMAFVVVGINAAQSQWSGQYEQLGQGMKGFGQRYWRGELDIFASNFITEGAMPSLLRLDPRYFRKGDGSGSSRTWYALSRIWKIRGDNGKTYFNAPELVGNAAMAGLGSLWYPQENRNLRAMGQRYVFQVGTDAAFNILKEFWPDIHDRLLKRGKQ
jgi:hypothetical protein